jgi:hypothetical protein
MDASLFLSLIDTGVLVFFVYAFYTGRIVSKITSDQMLDEANHRTTKVVKELASEIGETVEKAVYRGIHKANGEKRSKEFVGDSQQTL